MRKEEENASLPGVGANSVCRRQTKCEILLSPHPPPSAVGEKAKTKERVKRKEEREVADANSSNNNVKYGLIDLVPAPPKPSLGTPLGGANGFCRWTHREKKT